MQKGACVIFPSCNQKPLMQPLYPALLTCNVKGGTAKEAAEKLVASHVWLGALYFVSMLLENILAVYTKRYTNDPTLSSTPLSTFQKHNPRKETMICIKQFTATSGLEYRPHNQSPSAQSDISTLPTTSRHALYIFFIAHKGIYFICLLVCSHLSNQKVGISLLYPRDQTSKWHIVSAQ